MGKKHPYPLLPAQKNPARNYPAGFLIVLFPGNCAYENNRKKLTQPPPDFLGASPVWLAHPTIPANTAAHSNTVMVFVPHNHRFFTFPINLLLRIKNTFFIALSKPPPHANGLTR
jgi:hypothetical protein